MSEKESKYKIPTEYINLQTDFGFKYMFGTLKNKHILIRFLNALFDGKLLVEDIDYHDKEVLPAERDGKRIVYDVYCTSNIQRSDSSFFPAYQTDDAHVGCKTDHHFILEMQNIYNPPFEERVTYYTCKMVASQGKSGWEYCLDPVFAVIVTDFNFNHLTPRLLHDIVLTDKETGESFTDKVHIMLCSLKEVPGKWNDCRTELEEILFLIKNMDKMDNTSLAYLEGKYKAMFEAARSNNIKGDDIIRYHESLAYFREVQAGIRFAAKNASKEAREKALAEGRAEGLAEGRAEGRAEGSAEGRAEGPAEARAEGRAEANRLHAMRMLELGMDVDLISSITGLSVEEIKSTISQ